MRWIALLILFFGIPAGAQEKVDAEQLFRHLLSLEGSWAGESTKGWAGTLEVKMIARGSAVVSTSVVDPHPGETMVTVYHLDRDRVMLTHYCVAKNHPRLVATGWDPETATAKFEFLDGTNMSSRDAGHMDSVLMRFLDENRFSSTWSFYRDGEEAWLEEVIWKRTGE